MSTRALESETDMLGRALVVVVDDRVSRGETIDTIGPLVTELLGEAGLVVDGTIVVPGEAVAIRNALNTAVIGGVDVVITVGGTGVSPRAVTADATAGVLDRPIPGIAEAIRASGLAAGAVDHAHGFSWERAAQATRAVYTHAARSLGAAALSS